MKKISAVVLAAGMSRRMQNINKLLYPPAAPLLLSVIDKLPMEMLDEVVVVTGHQADQVKDLLSSKSVRFVHNPTFETGMASSLKAGIDAISTEIDGALICLGDMPDLQSSDYEQVIDAWQQSDHSIVIPTWQDQRGHPVVFAKEHFSRIAKLPDDDDGARKVIERTSHANKKLLTMPSSACLRDYDSLEEFKSNGPV